MRKRSPERRNNVSPVSRYSSYPFANSIALSLRGARTSVRWSVTRTIRLLAADDPGKRDLHALGPSRLSRDCAGYKLASTFPLAHWHAQGACVQEEERERARKESLRDGKFSQRRGVQKNSHSEQLCALGVFAPVQLREMPGRIRGPKCLQQVAPRRSKITAPCAAGGLSGAYRQLCAYLGPVHRGWAKVARVDQAANGGLGAQRLEQHTRRS